MVALVTTKFHQKLQLKFQSFNLHFDFFFGGGGGGACNGHDCKTQMIQNLKVVFIL